MVKKVEKMCKTLLKSLGIKIVKLCVKKLILQKSVEKNRFSYVFTFKVTYLFTSFSSLFLFNNIHFSTVPITTTNNFFNNNINN